eukprot:gene4870-biopygen9310
MRARPQNTEGTVVGTRFLHASSAEAMGRSTRTSHVGIVEHTSEGRERAEPAPCKTSAATGAVMSCIDARIDV